MELVLAACLATVLAPPGTVSAAKRPPRPGGVSAVDAYRESLPTSSGAQPVGSGSGSAIPLSPKARASLEAAGLLGAELKRIAASPKLGAPTARLRRMPPRSRAPSLGGGIAAASGALDGGSEHMVALLAALGATTIVCVGAATLRFRSRMSRH